MVADHLSPWGDQPVAPLFSKRNNSTYCFFIDGIPKTVPVRGYISMRMQFVPDESGVVSASAHGGEAPANWCSGS